MQAVDGADVAAGKVVTVCAAAGRHKRPPIRQAVILVRVMTGPFGVDREIELPTIGGIAGDFARALHKRTQIVGDGLGGDTYCSQRKNNPCRIGGYPLNILKKVSVLAIIDTRK